MDKALLQHAAIALLAGRGVLSEDRRAEADALAHLLIDLVETREAA